MTEFIQIWTQLLYFNYTVEALISAHHECKDICLQLSVCGIGNLKAISFLLTIESPIMLIKFL